MKKIENERNPRNGWILELSDNNSDDCRLFVQFRLCNKKGMWISGDNAESNEEFDLHDIENEADLKQLIDRICIPKKPVYATDGVQNMLMEWFNMFSDMKNEPLKYKVESIDFD